MPGNDIGEGTYTYNRIHALLQRNELMHGTVEPVPPQDDPPHPHK